MGCIIRPYHYRDVIMDLTIVYSTIYSGADERKHQSSASLAFGNSPVTCEFPAQMASNAENVSIWWRHHALTSTAVDTYEWLHPTKNDRWDYSYVPATN